MTKQKQNVRHRCVRRLLPCPVYDVESVESWLSDLALQEGLFLAKENFLAGGPLGFAKFEQGVPCAVRYRLECAPERFSGLNEPAPEAVELNERYGWDYVARCDRFYIYRSFDPGARELNTDPQVQAFALNRAFFWNIVQILVLGGLVLSVFWLALDGDTFLRLLLLPDWFFLMFFGCAAGRLVEFVSEFFHLSRLRKRLRSGVSLAHRKDWRSSSVFFHTLGFLTAALALCTFALYCFGLIGSFSGLGRKALADYPDDPPFATLAELAGGTAKELAASDEDQTANTFRIWSGPFTLRSMNWQEQAAVVCADGTVLEEILEVDYHQLRTSADAAALAQNYFRHDRNKQGCRTLESSVPEADLCILYTWPDTSQTGLVLQKGNAVLHVTFECISGPEPDYLLWTRRLLASIS